jgi:hypothetical protein
VDDADLQDAALAAGVEIVAEQVLDLGRIEPVQIERSVDRLLDRPRDFFSPASG